MITVCIYSIQPTNLQRHAHTLSLCEIFARSISHNLAMMCVIQLRRTDATRASWRGLMREREAGEGQAGQGGDSVGRGTEHSRAPAGHPCRPCPRQPATPPLPLRGCSPFPPPSLAAVPAWRTPHPTVSSLLLCFSSWQWHRSAPLTRFAFQYTRLRRAYKFQDRRCAIKCSLW